MRVTQDEVRYGAAAALAGRLHDRAAPLPGQAVMLEGRLYPFTGRYRVLARASTDGSGGFAFRPRLARNAQLRVAAPAQHLVSTVRLAYTYPAFTLAFRTVRPGVVRLVQRYRVPRRVHLTAATRFYLGARHTSRSSLRRSAPTLPGARGRFVSRVTVTLPRAWGGRFRFGSCFPTSAGSGMGKPDARCPRRYRF